MSTPTDITTGITTIGLNDEQKKQTLAALDHVIHVTSNGAIQATLIEARERIERGACDEKVWHPHPHYAAINEALG